MQIFASLKHRKKKSEPSRLIPFKAYSKPRAFNIVPNRQNLKVSVK